MNERNFDDTWRNNPTVPNPVWARDDVSWHDTGELADGTRVGKLGAMWYVLDDNGNAISEGYHEIRVKSKTLFGKRSTEFEPVTFKDEVRKG